MRIIMVLRKFRFSTSAKIITHQAIVLKIIFPEDGPIIIVINLGCHCENNDLPETGDHTNWLHAFLMITRNYCARLPGWCVCVCTKTLVKGGCERVFASYYHQDHPRWDICKHHHPHTARVNLTRGIAARTRTHRAYLDKNRHALTRGAIRRHTRGLIMWATVPFVC